tara:strand:+ start:473 stop:670 length:198 start_codon:yes stop_codon:yes gene_type:complete
MKITDENLKGLSLEDFVNFDYQELDLMEYICSTIKNCEPLDDIDSDKLEILDRIQAKILILKGQP